MLSISLRYVAALLLLGTPLLPAQDPTSSEILGASPIAGQQCHGPLGSLLPECQAGKTSISVSSSQVASPPVIGTSGKTTRAETAAPPPVQPAAPEPPTDFQRLVASSIGQMLPLYGSSLFENVPTTFAPLDRVPPTADYVIGPGDEILLRVWGQVNLDLTLTVDRAGAIFIPQAGNFSVAGLQYQQLPGFLRSQLERVFRNFDLSVNMGQLRSIQIFVVGHARRPGTYTVSSLSTLVNAVFASGGPARSGSMRHIQLKRGAQVVTDLDLYELLLNGDKSKDARLLPGDVVYVPPAGSQIAIAGSVKTPAIYELKTEASIAEAIRMTGGLTVIADIRRAGLERVRGNSREVIELPLDDAGLHAPLMDGDVLHIRTITPQFQNAVTLRGNVANPGRFPWRDGMRLRDIIPDKESLVTREYWKRRNALGFLSPAEALPADPSVEAQQSASRTRIESTLPELNWSYAVIERQSTRDLAAELVPFHLGKLVIERDERQNLELRPGDIVTIFSSTDIRTPVAQQRRLVRLEGEIAAAGVYSALAGETLGQLIQRAGGLTGEAYLFGSELLRESTRVDQQRRLDQFVQDMEREVESSGSVRLGNALTADESAATAAKIESQRRIIERLRAVKATGRVVLRLEPGSNEIAPLMPLPVEDGDRFIVPARPSTVNVLGSVYNQSSFRYEEGLRLADYLKKAGGANRGADKGRLFVIQADGSIVPKQGSGLFSPAFETRKLNPGDSIVVPETMFRTGFLHGLKDWTQVFSQLALGAAVVNVLK